MVGAAASYPAGVHVWTILLHPFIKNALHAFSIQDFSIIL